MKKFISLSLLAIIFNSCGLNKAKDAENTTSPDKTVLNFLNWYKDNFDEMHSFYIMSEKNDSTHLLSGKWGDSTVCYSVNPRGTEKFLNIIQASGFLSKKYISIKRESFKDRAIELSKTKQYDGPPAGFSAEEIFYLNDIEETFSSVDKAKAIKIKLGNKSAIYKIDILEGFVFHLSNYNGKWLIDEISN